MSAVKKIGLVGLLMVALVIVSCVARAPEPEPEAVVVPVLKPPSGPSDVLILGDSQLSFGLGRELTGFFRTAQARCAGLDQTVRPAKAASVGVRSTSLHHWTARNGPDKGPICDLDARFGVNASSFGVTGPGLSFVQIGQDAAHPFCRADSSVLSEVFQTEGFSPDLVVLAFLGNATERWQSPGTARADVQSAMAQLPRRAECLVMTTIPTFDAALNDKRVRAQSNLRQAVAGSGRCQFVAGLTSQTRAAIEGQPAFFKTNEAGEVVDQTHPTPQSAKLFVELQTPALCDALNVKKN